MLMRFTIPFRAMLALCTAAPASAAAQSADSVPADSAHAFVSGQNPTQVMTQFQPFVVIEALPNGVTGFIIEPSFFLAVRSNISLNVQVPYVFRTAGDAGGEGESGFSDPQIEVVFATPLGKSNRLRFDVAWGIYPKIGPPSLGNGSWVTQPSLGLSWQVKKGIQVIGVMTYQHSFDEDPGVTPIQSLLAQLFAVVRLPHHSYFIGQANPGYDFAGDQFVNNIQLQVGTFTNKKHTFGPWMQLAFNTGAKTSIYPYSVQVELGLAWLFPKKPK